jgi:hypothetical protein
MALNLNPSGSPTICETTGSRFAEWAACNPGEMKWHVLHELRRIAPLIPRTSLGADAFDYKAVALMNNAAQFVMGFRENKKIFNSAFGQVSYRPSIPCVTSTKFVIVIDKSPENVDHDWLPH